MRYVRLADGGGWIAAESAWLAVSASSRTPMGHGILAFSTESAARAADRQGRVHSWSEIGHLAAGER